MKGNNNSHRTPAVPLASLPGDFPDCAIPPDTDHAVVAAEWIDRLQHLQSDHLTSDALWRDLLALTGSLRTFSGSQAVLKAWQQTSHKHQPTRFSLIQGSSQIMRFGPRTSWVQARFEFVSQTDSALVAKNSGLIRVVVDEQQKWKIWLFSTILEEVEGWGNPDVPRFDEPNGHSVDNTSYPTGLNGHVVESSSATKGDHRTVPYFDVVVVGGGPSGLTTAGRLKALGLSALVIDRYQEPGANWTMRYESLKLHTAKEYGQLPFGKTFGPDYPYFLTAKDLAKGYQWWVQKYQINILHSSVVYKADWDEDKKLWTVHVEQQQGAESATLLSRHMVFAMGAGGTVPNMPDLPNRDQFQGEVLHSAGYKSARDWKGKKGVVIGAANTAHDVAEDMLLAELSSVTMVQRNATPVLPIEYYRHFFDPLYNDQTVIEIADREGMSLPNSIIRLQAKNGVASLASKEPERFDALERVGFKTDRYPDLYHIIYERLGGHYMDVGVSDMIKAGLIKMKSDAALKEFCPGGLRFDDGSELQADVIVFCTGFEGNVRNEVSKIVSESIGEQIDDYWRVDKEGEIRGAYKWTGHPGIWYAGGTVGMLRYFPRFLALQIKADMEGMPFERYTENS